jgi:hypothetical protein
MKHLFTVFLMLLLPAIVKAQSVGPAELNAYGKSVTNAGNTYEYAIGTVVAVPAYVSGTLVVTPGVLQPVLTETSGVEETAIPADALAVYPNPVDQVLFLKPAFGKKGTLQYSLIDAAGRTIKTQSAELQNGNELQQVPMSAFASGQYTLQVEWQQQGKTLNTAYKIQKIK